MPRKVKVRKTRIPSLDEQIEEGKSAVRKGEEWYQKLKGEFELAYLGQYIVIGIKNGEYVIGETRLEAILKAEKAKRRIGRSTYVKRIGLPDPHLASREY